MTQEEILTGLLSDATNINPVSFAGGLGYEAAPDKKGATFADVENLDPHSQRQRRSQFTQNLMFAKDAFDFITGIDPQAYAGKTAKLMNDYDKVRMEEDPEGYQRDMNRAKVLSQRASETDDPELKRKYGMAIKQLLPDETEGLDDITASTFLFSQSDKLQQQLLKNAGNLAVQQAKNVGNLATAGVRADSAENVANIRADASRDVAGIRGEYDLLKKDKDYLREELRQRGMTDRQADKIIADYERELMRQEHSDYRTEYAADRALEGRQYAADLGLEGRMYAADRGYEGRVYTADSAFDRNKYTVDANMYMNDADNRRAIEVATINANARVQAAKAKGNLAGVDALTGDIVPSGGVVEAVNFIENNRDLFSATNALLDTKLGRATGALSSETIQARDNVRQELQSLVQQSVKNLMQLFPKGGSGVINTATEQRFFVPVAEAIASGEANKILPAIKAFYGQMYDACAASGEPAPITRAEYIRLMMYGQTSDGKTRITRGGGNAQTSSQGNTTVGNFSGKVGKDGLIALTFD